LTAYRVTDGQDDVRTVQAQFRRDLDDFAGRYVSIRDSVPDDPEIVGTTRQQASESFSITGSPFLRSGTHSPERFCAFLAVRFPFAPVSAVE
jgi:hypothetical protein